MRKMIRYLLCLCLSPLVFAASNQAVRLESVTINLKDKASLQRGAKYYMNYCSGCHSLKYMRYSQMAKSLGLTTFDGEVDKDLLYNNLIFTEAKIHDPIEIAMPAADARQWFGIEPPDLSLIARRQGPDWIYTYLNSFYKDESRPFGANNLLIPGVAMPNVLASLQGQVMAVRKGAENSDAAISHLVLVKEGRMGQQEFDGAVEDIVNFLVYVGEPERLLRYKIGVWVMLFLFVFLLSAYRLKKAYWKRID